jgi:heat shock protein HslJ
LLELVEDLRREGLVTIHDGAYLAALLQATSFQVTDTQAVLADAGGNPVLRFVIPGPGLEGTTWTLESTVDAEGQVTAVLPDSQITAEFQDGELNGSAGCNNYFGGYEVAGNELAIPGPLGSTMMMCDAPEGVMEQEQAYLALLQQAATFEVTEELLLISNASLGVTLRFNVLQPASLTGTTWMVSGYNDGRGGFSSPLRDTEITAVFDEDGGLVGSAGCNQYTTSFEIDGESIAVGLLAISLKMCGEPEGIMEQEQAFASALAAVSTFTIEGDQLEMRDAEGTRMLAFVAGE